MCSAESCDRPVRCLGLCALHYARFYRNGDVVRHKRRLRPPTARFWEKVDKAGPVVRPDLGPCWVFTGARQRGYGVFHWQGRTIQTHVFAWIEANGPRPSGAYICHRCDNPSCVRPDHLYVGTPTDNNRDSVERGRRHPPVLDHCKRGHPFDATNAYLHGGSRHCLTCKAARDRLYKQRRKAVA